MKKTEQRQMEVLRFMMETIQRKGFPPTVREIANALGIRSTSTVHSDIKELSAKGYLRKDPSKPRAIVLTDAGAEAAGIRESADGAAEEASREEAVPEPLTDYEMVELPLIGRVAAGTPILSQENIEEYIAFPSRFIGHGNHFLLVVHGSSMINAGIQDGDYLIVQEEHEAHNGDIVVAMIPGDYDYESTVKRFYREKDHIRLQPENDAMDPILVDDCQIVGKVKGVFRYFS